MTERTQVIQTIAGLREDHGGTSRSVPALCDALSGHGATVHLVVGIPSAETVAVNFPAGSCQVHAARESTYVRQWGVSRQFQAHIRHLIQDANSPWIIHDHGLWLATNHAVAKVSNQLSVPRIVSPRGMLSAWALRRRRTTKRVVWKLYQRRDLESAAAFHATSRAEADEIRALGFKQPIALIPNGVQFPRSIPPRTDSARSILFLSRIHPKKGLANLVRAFSQMRAPKDWKLTVAGPDESGHRAQIERVVADLGLSERVSFVGPVDDCSKWGLYANADLFVLPSFSENFGICVAEAMVAGVPVIASTATPWKVLEDNNYGWWVEPEVDAWAETMAAACRLDDAARKKMGRSASSFARREFAWTSVGLQMKAFYEWVVGAQPTPPACVLA